MFKNILVEKYNPAYISYYYDEIMSKRLVPGFYFWPVALPLVVGLVLALLFSAEWLWLAICAPILIAFGIFFSAVVVVGDWDDKQCRPFYRRRLNFELRNNSLDVANPGPEYIKKLTEYLDMYRSGCNRDAETERFLLRLHSKESTKRELAESLAKQNNPVKSVINEEILERIDMEVDALREVSK